MRVVLQMADTFADTDDNLNAVRTAGLNHAPKCFFDQVLEGISKAGADQSLALESTLFYCLVEVRLLVNARLASARSELRWQAGIVRMDQGDEEFEPYMKV